MKKCPRCFKMTMRDEEVRNALSRRDNKTYICSPCGEAEAMIDAGFARKDAHEFEFCAKVAEREVFNNFKTLDIRKDKK
jgi:hypothetical protein